jgi:integrase
LQYRAGVIRTHKTLFRSAKRDGYIIEDPAEFVESVRKTGEDPRRPFTSPEIRSVYDLADQEWKSLILFGLYTGQRLSDLAILSWENIDLARNEIRLTADYPSVPRTRLAAWHVQSVKGSKANRAV